MRVLVAVVLLSAFVSSMLSPVSSFGSTATAADSADLHENAGFMRFLNVNSYTFDPLDSIPSISNSLRYDLGAGIDPGYYIVQLNGPVRPEMKLQLESVGAKMLYYVNYNAFVVRADSSVVQLAALLPDTRWSGVFEPAYKLSPRLHENYDEIIRMVESHSSIERTSEDEKDAFEEDIEALLGAYSPEGIAKLGDGPLSVEILTFEKENVPGVLRRIAELAGRNIEFSQRYSGVIHADLERPALPLLAREFGVMWIDRQIDMSFYNDIARWVVQSGDGVSFGTPIHDHGLWGTGQKVTIGDTGIDYDHNAFEDPSNPLPGPAHRKVTAYYVPEGGGGDLTDNGINHGTHVAGSIAGDDGVWHVYDGDPAGASDSLGPHDGQAFDAQLNVQDLSYDGDAVSTPVDLRTLWQEALDMGSLEHSNSWGGFLGEYTVPSYQADDFIWNNPDFSVLFAAGNLGDFGPTLMSTLAVSKNVICVGASYNGDYRDSVAWFSSRGPSIDGRLKPDIIAPGVDIWSACGYDPSGGCGDDYWQMTGTSMATPTVAGALALVRQYYMDGFFPTGSAVTANGFTPSAALLKATLINGAVEVNGIDAYYYGETWYPNNQQGWGRILLDNSLYFEGDTRNLYLDDHRYGVTTGEKVVYEIPIISSEEPLEITLVWSDYPGTPYSYPNLVNDLDLTVTAPNGTVYMGNRYVGYDPGESEANPDAHDRLNNVEGVLILSAPAMGTWSVEVSGFNVPMGPQPYALVISGAVANEAGRVAVDKSVYKSTDSIEIEVIDLDMDLNAGSPDLAQVDVSSTTEPIPETVTLLETGSSTSVFRGTIALNPGVAGIPGNGQLEVQSGDDVTCAYFDANDGLGGSAWRYGHASVDDDPPVISAVEVVDVTFNQARITWKTDENSDSVVCYGTSLPPSLQVVNAGIVKNHSIALRDLEDRSVYYFYVQSADIVGNSAYDDNSSSYYSFATPPMPIANLADADWPAFQNNQMRQGCSPSRLVPPLEEVWRTEDLDAVYWHSNFVYSDGHLVQYCSDGVLRALNPFTGSELWHTALNEASGDGFVTPVIANGVVYVTASIYELGEVFAVDLYTGDTLWTMGPESGLNYYPGAEMAFADGMLFGCTYDDEVYALRAEDGSIVWSYQTGEWVVGGPSIANGSLYIGFYSGTILCLDEFTGARKWSCALDGSTTSPPLVTDSCVFAGTSGGSMFCLDREDGHVVWQRNGFGTSYGSTPAYDGASIYYSSISNCIVALNATTGELLWQTPVLIGGEGSVAYANGYLYASLPFGAYDYFTYLVVLDASCGRLVECHFLSAYGLACSPAVSDGWVWVIDADDRAHGFRGSISIGVSALPREQESDAAAGSTVDYRFEVANTGFEGVDTYDIQAELGENGWTAALFESDGVTPLSDSDADGMLDTGLLDPGEAKNITVRILVDALADLGDCDRTSLHISSSRDDRICRFVAVVTTVPYPGVSIGPRIFETVRAGDLVSVKLNVTNAGGLPDRIELSTSSPHGWSIDIMDSDGFTSLPDTDGDGVPDTDILEGLEPYTVVLNIHVPSSAKNGTVDIAELRGFSDTTPSASAMRYVTCEVSPIPSAEWPTYHHDAARTGVAAGDPEPPLSVLWASDTSDCVETTGPVLSDGILFSTSYYDGTVTARDPYTGDVLWKKTIGEGGGSGYPITVPTVAEGVVYVASLRFYHGSDTAELFALDEFSGETLWAIGPESGMRFRPDTAMTCHAGLLFGITYDGELYALDAVNGSLVWKHNSRDHCPAFVPGMAYGLSAPAIAYGLVYFGTTAGYALALDEFTGELVWYVSLEPGLVFSAPVVAQGCVYFHLDCGFFVALDAFTGAEVWWAANVEGAYGSTPAYDGEFLYLGAGIPGFYTCLNATTGAMKWQTITGTLADGSVVYAAGRIYGCSGGLLYIFNASDGSIVDSYYVSTTTGSSPVISDDFVWVVDTWDGRLMAFRGAPQEVGFDVAPACQRRLVIPDSVARFSVNLTNTGLSGTDLFQALALPGELGWPINLYESDGATLLSDNDGDGVPDTGYLPTGTTCEVIVDIHAPSGAQPGDLEDSGVLFVSGKNENVSKSIRAIVSVPMPAIGIGPDQRLTVQAGEEVSVMLNVTNRGFVPDVIEIAADSSHGWSIQLLESDGINALGDSDGDSSQDVGEVVGGEALQIVVKVSCPVNVTMAVLDLVNVQARSSVDPDIANSSSVLLCVAELESGGWPQYQHDPQHTGSSETEFPRGLSLEWTYETGGNAAATTGPVIHNGTVFATCDDGSVMALNISSGELVWRTEVGSIGLCASTPAVAYGNVYVVIITNQQLALSLVCIDEMTGDVVWTYGSPHGRDVETTPTVGGGLVFWNDQYSVYANDAVSGDLLWKYYMGGLSTTTGPTYWEGLVFVCETAGITALDALTGRVVWICCEATGSGAVAVANGVLYGTAWWDAAFAVDCHTGQLLWCSTGFGDFGIHTPALAEGVLFVTSTGYSGWGTSHALDATTGAPLWTTPCSIGVSGVSPVFNNGTLFAPFGDGSIYALDASNGALLQTEAASEGRVLSSPAIGDGFLVVEDSAGCLECFRLAAVALPVSTVQASPSQANVTVAQLVELEAHAFDAEGSEVAGVQFNWSSTYALGTIIPLDVFNSRVSYSAGTVVGEDLVVVEACGISVTVTIQVIPGEAYQIDIQPDGASVVVNQTLQFTATASDFFGNPLPDAQFDWSVTGSLGTIDQTGLFRAATVVGVGSVTAELDGLQKIVPVSLEPDELAVIIASPDELVIEVGATAEITASGFDVFGNTVTSPGYSWLATEGFVYATNGDGSSVEYVAPTHPCSSTVSVTYVSVSTEILVTVIPGPPATLALTPVGPVLTVGESLAFSASVADGFGNALADIMLFWAASVGVVTQDGVFTAPTVPCQPVVNVSAGTLANETTVTVVVGVLNHIGASVDSINTTVNSTVSIDVDAQDEYENEITGLSFVWSTTIGAIHPSSDGSSAVFSAGNNSGNGTITVSCSGTSLTINVTVREVPAPPPQPGPTHDEPIWPWYLAVAVAAALVATFVVVLTRRRGQERSDAKGQEDEENETLTPKGQ